MIDSSQSMVRSAAAAVGKLTPLWHPSPKDLGGEYLDGKGMRTLQKPRIHIKETVPLILNGC